MLKNFYQISPKHEFDFDRKSIENRNFSIIFNKN